VLYAAFRSNFQNSHRTDEPYINGMQYLRRKDVCVPESEMDNGYPETTI